MVLLRVEARVRHSRCDSIANSAPAAHSSRRVSCKVNFAGAGFISPAPSREHQPPRLGSAVPPDSSPPSTAERWMEPSPRTATRSERADPAPTPSSASSVREAPHRPTCASPSPETLLTSDARPGYLAFTSRVRRVPGAGCLPSAPGDLWSQEAT